MISWSESIDIARPVAEVYSALRDQHSLMEWSAWPEATGYSCAVEGDGTSTGSSIVFTAQSGEEMGRQTITAVTETSVYNRLRNRGPGGRVVEPELDLHAQSLGPATTRVRLDFRIVPPVSRLLHPVARILLAWRIRPVHRKDLRKLKQQLERASA